jgi:hypothetical protein
MIEVGGETFTEFAKMDLGHFADSAILFRLGRLRTPLAGNSKTGIEGFACVR